MLLRQRDNAILVPVIAGLGGVAHFIPIYAFIFFGHFACLVRNPPPLFAPLAAGAPDDEPPPAEPPELCASANVLLEANATASAIIVSFTDISLVCVQDNREI